MKINWGGGEELGASCSESRALTSCANAFYFIHVSSILFRGSSLQKMRWRCFEEIHGGRDGFVRAGRWLRMRRKSIPQLHGKTGKDLQSVLNAPFHGSEGRLEEVFKETNWTKYRGDEGFKVFIS